MLVSRGCWCPLTLFGKKMWRDLRRTSGGGPHGRLPPLGRLAIKTKPPPKARKAPKYHSATVSDLITSTLQQLRMDEFVSEKLEEWNLNTLKDIFEDSDDKKTNVSLGLLLCILPPGRKGNKRASIDEDI